MIGGYKIRNQLAAHFMTFTVVDWIDIFTRKIYRDILLDNLKYCQHNKGLILNAWCIMSNHMHLVASSGRGELSNFIRDYKSHTSLKLIEAIRDNPKETRKEWILSLLAQHGEENMRNTKLQLWKQDNHPEECYSAAFTFQKINYIHENPVKAGIVTNAWEYVYSSAMDYHKGSKCGILDIVI